MQKFFIILIMSFSLQITLSAQEYWISQNSPTTKNLSACFFTDSLNGWIGGDSGLIIHTTNKGVSWNMQSSGVTFGIVSIYFVNKHLGFALSPEYDNTPPNYYGTRILMTKDGGKSWNNYLFADTAVFFNTIYFLDSLNGFIGGSEGKLFYTTNSGNSWTQSTMDSGIVFGFPVEEIKFYDAMTGYAAGGAFDIAGLIWNTTNGGRSWSTKIVGSEPINDIHIIDANNIIGVGGDFEYGASSVRTSTGGSVWNYRELGVFGIANSIGYRTNNEAWISLGIVDSFLISTNGGYNWRITGTPGSSRIYDIFFTDSTNGWAVGVDGVILKYNFNVIGINDHEEFLPGDITLHQNYPNPFNPVTVINYEINTYNGKSRKVSLIVYDVTGKEVARLVDQLQYSGLHKVIFDGSILHSGIYFYKLTVSGENSDSEFTQSRKMVILK